MCTPYACVCMHLYVRMHVGLRRCRYYHCLRRSLVIHTFVGYTYRPVARLGRGGGGFRGRDPK